MAYIRRGRLTAAVLAGKAHRREGGVAVVHYPPADRAAESAGREVFAGPAGEPRVLCIRTTLPRGPGWTSGFEGRNRGTETFSEGQSNFQPPLTIRVQLPSASSILSYPERKQWIYQRESYKRLKAAITSDNLIGLLPDLNYYSPT